MRDRPNKTKLTDRKVDHCPIKIKRVSLKERPKKGKKEVDQKKDQQKGRPKARKKNKSAKKRNDWKKYKIDRPKERKADWLKWRRKR